MNDEKLIAALQQIGSIEGKVNSIEGKVDSHEISIRELYSRVGEQESRLRVSDVSVTQIKENLKDGMKDIKTSFEKFDESQEKKMEAFKLEVLDILKKPKKRWETILIGLASGGGVAVFGWALSFLSK